MFNLLPFGPTTSGQSRDAACSPHFPHDLDRITQVCSAREFVKPARQSTMWPRHAFLICSLPALLGFARSCQCASESETAIPDLVEMVNVGYAVRGDGDAPAFKRTAKEII